MIAGDFAEAREDARNVPCQCVGKVVRPESAAGCFADEHGRQQSVALQAAAAALPGDYPNKDVLRHAGSAAHVRVLRQRLCLHGETHGTNRTKNCLDAKL
jgi:hypothetical protein